ncbi:unnamed protein product [Anisakis simplex]|uniref:Rho guanine nucleotide exchange factor 35 (inferred by orthology to a human protein) n=1 Tax=Anisakis simplex TaxID=6269 RepID=A0A0M3JR12_ANISI|nr:unnamed protein product [Anisakis simplex]
MNPPSRTTSAETDLRTRLDSSSDISKSLIVSSASQQQHQRKTENHHSKKGHSDDHSNETGRTKDDSSNDNCDHNQQQTSPISRSDNALNNSGMANYGNDNNIDNSAAMMNKEEDRSVDDNVECGGIAALPSAASLLREKKVNSLTDSNNHERLIASVVKKSHNMKRTCDNNIDETIKKPTVKPPPPPIHLPRPSVLLLREQAHSASLPLNTTNTNNGTDNKRLSSSKISNLTTLIKSQSNVIGNQSENNDQRKKSSDTSDQTSMPSSSKSFSSNESRPTEHSNGHKIVPKSPRFERKCVEGAEIPRVPSIPPPSPPKLSERDVSDEDDMYEEIAQAISIPEAFSDSDNYSDEKVNHLERSVCVCKPSITSSSSKNHVSDKDEDIYSLADEIVECEEPENNHDQVAENKLKSKRLQIKCDQSGESEDEFERCPSNAEEGNGSSVFIQKNQSSADSTAFRKKSLPSCVRRPMSTLELDKLLRIKSDIQFNITKKVGQIKLKVTSSSQEKQRRDRAMSMFYVDNADNQANEECIARMQFPLDEECIYGDDWSSTDEDDDMHKSNTNQKSSEICVGLEGLGTSKSDVVVNKCVDDVNKPISMLSEIEQELNIRLTSANSPTNLLPDVVPKSEVKSLNGNMESSSYSIDCDSETIQSDDGDMELNEINKNFSSSSPSSHVNNLHEALKTTMTVHSLRTTQDGYETVLVSPSKLSIQENNTDLPKSPSDETFSDVDRFVYVPRFLPEPQPLYQIYMMEQQQKDGIVFDVHQNNNITDLTSVFSGEIAQNSSDHKNIYSHLNVMIVITIMNGRNILVVMISSDFQVRRNSSSGSTDSGRGADCSTTVSHITSNPSMRRERLVAASHFGSQRSLWCELTEVKNSGLLEKLDDREKKLQEAYFEVITSEASYLRSLNILITHFMAASELLGSKGTSSIICNEERKRLFSNIFSVRDCSERLLCDLESRLEESLVLTDVCDILCEHFNSYFDPYIKYCSNQVYQDRTLKRLKFLLISFIFIHLFIFILPLDINAKNTPTVSYNLMNESTVIFRCYSSAFLSCIERLESDRLCQGLDMRSFLMLPMQRITRYPLLVIAVLDRVPAESVQHKTAQMALNLANYVVKCCNEGARLMDRTEQLLQIERCLVYKSADLRRIPLVSSGRYLVKRGSLLHLIGVRPKNLLHSRQRSHNIHLFLFNDILMITKKKLNGTFVCKDYSARRFVDVEPVELDSPKVPAAAISNLQTKPHLFICTLMHNARGRQVELLLNADSESDRERWLSALRPPTCSNPEEKVYADWDCPQAAAVHNYTASQEDELSLQKGDIVNILRKMPDGWYYGERVRDSCGGWFPSSYVQQLLNDHVRANNYRQRLRVMQAALDYRLQQEHLKATNENISRRAPHLIDRFRRLSNPKTLFNA